MSLIFEAKCIFLPTLISSLEVTYIAFYVIEIAVL